MKNLKEISTGVKFYLDASESKPKTIGDVVIGFAQDVYGGDVPEYLCFRCHKHFTIKEGDICSWCVDDIINHERIIQQEIDGFNSHQKRGVLK